MGMVQATLASELETAWGTPLNTESDAIDAFATAYAMYALDAETAVTFVPITVAGVALGEAAMRTALIGMSVTGLVAIPAAVIAFWAAVAVGLATSFVGATAITPPPHATLAVDLPVTFTANKTGSKSVADSAAAIAADLYAAAIIGGTVTLPIPATEPII